jgi:hypothetical protein
MDECGGGEDGGEGICLSEAPIRRMIINLKKKKNIIHRFCMTNPTNFYTLGQWT